ncbi:MAG: DUF6428 family protein [Verrucomicrobiota bacterium]
MTISELKETLAGHEGKALVFRLPDGESIPPHFHVTEIGFVRKEFIDCGGTVRTEGKCLLQVWVANDVDHRVDVGKLLQIMEHGKPVLPMAALPIEIEYEHPWVSHFPLESFEIDDENVVAVLTTRHTDCLAKDVCGIDEEDSCAVGSGCC